jgi:triacylglycerol lipase
MPLTLSPYRYLQSAQYAIRHWAEQVPRGAAAAWKGKGRAETSVRRQPNTVLGTSRTDGLLKATVQESTPSKAGQGIAGPSRHEDSYKEPEKGQKPVGPDPKDPKLPQEQPKIYSLMNDSRLLHPESIKPPREVVVLCHGRSIVALDGSKLSSQDCTDSQRRLQYPSSLR